MTLKVQQFLPKYSRASSALTWLTKLISCPRMPSPFLPLRMDKVSCLFLNLHLPGNFHSLLKVFPCWWMSSPLWMLQWGPSVTHNARPTLYSFWSPLYRFTACVLQKHHSSSASPVLCNAQLLSLFHLTDFTDLSHHFSCCSGLALPFFMSFTFITWSALPPFWFVSASVTDTHSLRHRCNCHRPKKKEG